MVSPADRQTTDKIERVCAAHQWPCMVRRVKRKGHIGLYAVEPYRANGPMPDVIHELALAVGARWVGLLQHLGRYLIGIRK